MTKREATAAAATAVLPEGASSDRRPFKSGGHWWITVTLPALANGMANKTAARLG